MNETLVTSKIPLDEVTSVRASRLSEGREVECAGAFWRREIACRQSVQSASEGLTAGADFIGRRHDAQQRSLLYVLERFERETGQ